MSTPLTQPPVSSLRHRPFIRRISKFQSTRVLFAAVFVMAGAYFALQAFAAPNSNSHGGNSSLPSSSVSFSLSPASAKVSMAQGNFTIGVYEDSQTNTVNAVQAELSYPVDKFDFVSVDSTNSAFEVSAHESGGNGTIIIDRGTTSQLTGHQLVASVVLKPKVSSGKAVLTFTGDNEILSSTTNTSILQATFGGTYSFAR